MPDDPIISSCRLQIDDVNPNILLYSGATTPNAVLPVKKVVWVVSFDSVRLMIVERRW